MRINSLAKSECLHCFHKHLCFIWATVYKNISIVIKDLDMEIYRARGDWTDENNRHLLCEMEGGIVRTLNFAMAVRKGTPIF
jgi:hypothetical protein